MTGKFWNIYILNSGWTKIVLFFDREDVKHKTRSFVVNETSELELQVMVSDRVHPKYGRCYTFRIPESQKNLGLNTLTIGLKKNLGFAFRFFFHADDQFFEATNRQMGLHLKSNESASAQISYSQIRTIQKFNFIGGEPSCRWWN